MQQQVLVLFGTAALRCRSIKLVGALEVSRDEHCECVTSRLNRTRVTANGVAYSKPGKILIYVGISMQGNKPPRPRAGSVCMQLHRELT